MVELIFLYNYITISLYNRLPKDIKKVQKFKRLYDEVMFTNEWRMFEKRYY